MSSCRQKKLTTSNKPLSADGAMVSLQHGEWGEVRTLALGDVQAAVQEQDTWVVHTKDITYFSRLVDVRQFEHLSLVEFHRRGLEQAGKWQP